MLGCLIVTPPQDEHKVPIKLALPSLEVADSTLNHLLLPGIRRNSKVSDISSIALSSAGTSMRSMALTPQNVFCATPLTFASAWSPKYVEPLNSASFCMPETEIAENVAAHTPRALFNRGSDVSEWMSEDVESAFLRETTGSLRETTGSCGRTAGSAAYLGVGSAARSTGVGSVAPSTTRDVSRATEKTESWWSAGYYAPAPFGNIADAETIQHTSRRQQRRFLNCRLFRKNRIQAGQKSGLGLRDDFGTYTLDSVMRQSSSAVGTIESTVSSSSDPFQATTLMIRNLPRRKTRDEIEELLLESGFRHRYDFVFMPFCFYSNRNYGYGFINFVTSADAKWFQETWHKKRLFAGRKQRNVTVSVAEVQGREANIQLSIRHQRLCHA